MIKSFKDTVVRIAKHKINQTVQTSYPAIILSTDNYSTNQTIVVKPLIQVEYEDGEIVELPTIYDVPVVLPSAKDCLISVPLKAGDTVALQFCKNSLEEFLEQEEPFNYNPVDNRFFAFTDCFAYPCVWTKKNNLQPHPDNVEMKFKDVMFSLRPTGEVLLNNANVSTTYSPDGTVVTKNEKLTITFDSSGNAIIDNGSGKFELASSGIVTINGVTIDTSGNITTPTTVTAVSMTASSGMASPSVKANGVEMAGHKHNQGTYKDAESRPLTGLSGAAQ